MTINKLEWKIKYKYMDEYNGYTHHNTLTIYIHSELKKANPIQLRRIVFHEVSHAYFYSYGFGYETQFNLEQMVELYAHNVDNLNELTDVALKELSEVEE